MASLPDQCLAEGSEHLGSLRSGRQRWHQAYGGLIFRYRILTAGCMEIAAEERVQQAGAYGVGGLIYCAESRLRQGDRPARVTGEIGRLGRIPQHRGTVETKSLFRIGNLIPKLENRLEMTPRVGETVRRLGLQPGFQRGRQRLRRLMCPDPVVGKPSRRVAMAGIGEPGVLGECRGKSRMQLSPLARQ